MQFKQFLGAALAIVAVKAQDNSTANLTSVLSGNDNLSSLVTVLEDNPDIAQALSDAQNITILAPSNQALEALNSTGGQASREGFIQALLNYHVLIGQFSSDNITDVPTFAPTMLNDTAFANVTGGQVVELRSDDDDAFVISGFKNNASVTEADIAYNGGIVHIIDSLLTIPPNVSTVAQEANLTAFLGAINATDLADTLDTTSDLTIFAPNNAAFQSISSVLANISTEEAAAVLQYHVLNGTVAYSSTLANGSVPTLGGDNITITILDGEVFVNRARVINADILLSNGVLHILDSVLSSNDSSPANGTESDDTPATAFPGASSGSDVPFTSGQPSPTSTNAALTSTEPAVAEGFPTNTGNVGDNTAGNPEASSSTSSDGAVMPTGAIGAAALFGGAAILANF
ncbi:hypothetical protein Q7P37_001590 [Cladosporium fusiforme]